MAKILIISTYPPPMCGWAIQTKLLAGELRRRGHTCDVLNINENRKKKSTDYVDVQNGFDYLIKLVRFGLRGYRFHAHVNAMGYKLYVLALAALLVARLTGRPGILTFHGGLPQTYFPRPDSLLLRFAYRTLFRLAGRVTCDSPEIKQAIESYGIAPGRVAAIPCFSAELLDFQNVALAEEVETFLAEHRPVFFCYVSYRPEYQLDVLREAMKKFCECERRAGFIWLGFPARELSEAEKFVRSWPEQEAANALVLGNLTHDEFLTLLTRCTAFIRTPACDGISASVLESLACGVPVVASQNGRRPAGVITYEERNATDLCAKLSYLLENYARIKLETRLQDADNNTSRTADLLLDASLTITPKEIAHAG